MKKIRRLIRKLSCDGRRMIVGIPQKVIEELKASQLVNNRDYFIAESEEHMRQLRNNDDNYLVFVPEEINYFAEKSTHLYTSFN